MNKRGTPKDDYRWWEYMAKFTDGKLVSIHTIADFNERHSQGGS